MANIYKVKIGNVYSKRNYTRQGAIALRKKWEDMGQEPKVVVWKKHKMVMDTMADITGVINFYRNPTEKELRQMLKQEAKK